MWRRVRLTSWRDGVHQRVWWTPTAAGVRDGAAGTAPVDGRGEAADRRGDAGPRVVGVGGGETARHQHQPPVQVESAGRRLGRLNRQLLEGPAFVPIGVVGRADDGGPALLARMPSAEVGSRQNGPGEPWQPSGPEGRAGVIEIALPGGARVRVDALVDGRALTRVLSALKRCR